MRHSDRPPSHASGAQHATWQHEIRRINQLDGAPPKSYRPQPASSHAWFIEDRSIFAQLAKIDA